VRSANSLAGLATLVIPAFLVGCGGSAPTEPNAPTITAEHLRAMPAEEADSLSTRQNLAQPRNTRLVSNF
jgi:hypothetical protein